MILVYHELSDDMKIYEGIGYKNLLGSFKGYGYTFHGAKGRYQSETVLTTLSDWIILRGPRSIKRK